jgi:predicted nucleic acid-binding Zn ribbon protein
MPIYIFQNPKTQETIEVVQRMTEKHAYTDSDNLEWNRVWLTSSINMDGTISAWSSNDFHKTTENKNYTMGEMWDKSAELSAARAGKNGGVDPVKEQWKKDYSKQRKGTKYSEGGNLLGGTDAPTVEFTD